MERVIIGLDKDGEVTEDKDKAVIIWDEEYDDSGNLIDSSVCRQAES